MINGSGPVGRPRRIGHADNHPGTGGRARGGGGGRGLRRPHDRRGGAPTSGSRSTWATRRPSGRGRAGSDRGVRRLPSAPYCGEMEPLVQRLLAEYGRPHPLRLQAVPAVLPRPRAARGGGVAGRERPRQFWPYHDALYAHQTPSPAPTSRGTRGPGARPRRLQPRPRRQELRGRGGGRLRARGGAGVPGTPPSSSTAASRSAPSPTASYATWWRRSSS